ncbi:flagellar motor switch phosphatase FliY [Agathobacter sp.]|uniref:flagellar motor switch phosphatase FliY n=1 Tax=Agathobacter sp. TaxID=2021311 RepID=UPI003FD8C9E7
MDGVLSQEEINALLNNNDAADSGNEILTDSEKDAIGEIANISMGTAATTLFSLVNRRVEISTPVVSFSNWDKIVDEYEKPCVFIKIGYTQGLNGSNILVLREKDVKIITDLMMGGDGTNINGEIGELHLSAISEAMNQMMGSSATSLSSMLNRTIDISPPIAEVVDLKNTLNEGEIDSFLSEEFVKISFRMEIGDLVDSEIMQLYPPAFVKDMCKGVSQNMELDTQSVTEDVPQSANTVTQTASKQQTQSAGGMNNASANNQSMINENMMNQNMNSQNMMNQSMGAQNMMGNQVNVQTAQFTPFGAMPNQAYQPENIDLIMDVPLEVTVELGRTKKSISEILDFGPGKIIELNKLAGEPIDILVNGKYVAKGEVVVIEESFGVRITEIVNSKINTGKTK